MSSLSTPGS
uniref:Uncharacterized protein n=1 Tax=Arundo donax TaxID=35708 RepID=A0A0A9BZ21_ARUDO